MTVKTYDSKDNEITEDQVGYEGQTEHILNGVKTYTGMPSKKEDFFTYLDSSDYFDDVSSRTDVNEIVNTYTSEDQTSELREQISILCNLEAKLGIREFLWFINTEIRNQKTLNIPDSVIYRHDAGRMF